MNSKLKPAIKAPTEATLKALDKRLAELKELDQSLDAKCRITAIAVQAAGYGLALPTTISDPTDAYQWFQQASANRGRFTASQAHLDVASEIRNEFLTPLEAERQAARDQIKEIEQQRRDVKQALESATAPAMILEYEAQAKLLDKSRKANQANADRLGKDAATLRMELTDMAAAEQSFDEKLALAVTKGEPVDDEFLTSMAAQRIARDKRLKVTIAAQQKATSDAKADRQAIDHIRTEINRLQAVLETNKIQTALAATVEQLVAEGLARSRIAGLMHSFN